MMSQNVPISVVAMLPRRLRPRLRAAVQRLSGTIVWVSTHPALWQSLHAAPATCVVISLGRASDARGALIEALLHYQPPVPVLVYASATRASFKVLSRLSRQGLTELVLARYEDTPIRFAHTLQRIARCRG